MTNINRDYGGRFVTSKRPWSWYYDRLPKALRKALQESDHNWSDMVVYAHWKGCYGYRKGSIEQIVTLIRDNDARLAYNWMKRDETV